MTKSVLVGICVFISIPLLTQYISYQRYLIRKKAEQQNVLRKLQSVNGHLTAFLRYSLSEVLTLAFIVPAHAVPKNFDRVASNISQAVQCIGALIPKPEQNYF